MNKMKWRSYCNPTCLPFGHISTRGASAFCGDLMFDGSSLICWSCDLIVQRPDSLWCNPRAILPNFGGARPVPMSFRPGNSLSIWSKTLAYLFWSCGNRLILPPILLLHPRSILKRQVKVWSCLYPSRSSWDVPMILCHEFLNRAVERSRM